MATTADILQAIANLTARLNEIEANSKGTEDFQQQATLVKESLIRVLNGSVSENITVQQILDEAQSLVDTQSIYDAIPTNTSDLENDKIIQTITSLNDITEEGTYLWQVQEGEVTYEYRTNVDYLDGGNLSFRDIVEGDSRNNVVFVGGLDRQLIVEAKYISSPEKDLLESRLLEPSNTLFGSYANYTDAQLQTLKSSLNTSPEDYISVTLNDQFAGVTIPAGVEIKFYLFYREDEFDDKYSFASNSSIYVTQGSITNAQAISLRNDLNTYYQQSALSYGDEDNEGNSITSYTSFPVYFAQGTELVRGDIVEDIVDVNLLDGNVVTAEIKNPLTREKVATYYEYQAHISNGVSSSDPVFVFDKDYVSDIPDLDNILVTIDSIPRESFLRMTYTTQTATFFEGMIDITNEVPSSLLSRGVKEAKVILRSEDSNNKVISVHAGRIFDDPENTSTTRFVVKDPLGSFSELTSFKNITVELLLNIDYQQDFIQRTVEGGVNVVNVEANSTSGHHDRMAGRTYWAYWAFGGGKTPTFNHEFAPSSIALTRQSLDYYSRLYEASFFSAPIASLQYSIIEYLPKNIFLCFSLGSNTNALEAHEFGFFPGEYHPNLIVVRGGVLNEANSTATSSWGIGVTFTEPSSSAWVSSNMGVYYDHTQAEANKTAINGGADPVNNYQLGVSTYSDINSTESDQSPSSAYLSGKIALICDESGVYDPILVSKAMVETADRFSDYLLFSTTGYTWLTDLPIQKNYENPLLYKGAIKNESRTGDLLLINDLEVNSSFDYNGGEYVFQNYDLSQHITEEGTFKIEIESGSTGSVLYRDYISVWSTPSFTGDYSKIDNRWNPFDGYGIVNPTAAIAWLQGTEKQTIIDNNKGALIDRLGISDGFNYEDIPENVPVPKRLLPKAVESAPTVNTISSNTIDGVFLSLTPVIINNVVQATVRVNGIYTGGSDTVIQFQILPVSNEAFDSAYGLVFNSDASVFNRFIVDGDTVFLNVKANQVFSNHYGTTTYVIQSI